MDDGGWVGLLDFDFEVGRWRWERGLMLMWKQRRHTSQINETRPINPLTINHNLIPRALSPTARKTRNERSNEHIGLRSGDIVKFC